MDPYSKFKQEAFKEIEEMSQDEKLREFAQQWRLAVRKYKYPYHFEWLGRPIIQYPQDMIAAQELIWSVKPDLIIETGIAHGGSLMLSSSMLALIDICEALQSGNSFDLACRHRKVLGIDIDIRKHNREAIDAHPLFPYIEMIEGSSIAPSIIKLVHKAAINFKKIMIFLDSNHTHDHVLAELEAYAPLVTPGSYCVVFDTIIDDTPADAFPDRPWKPGNNPKTAVREYLRRLNEEGRTAKDGKPLRFETDKMIENKLLITVAPDGYLKREG